MEVVLAAVALEVVVPVAVVLEAEVPAVVVPVAVVPVAPVAGALEVVVLEVVVPVAAQEAVDPVEVSTVRLVTSTSKASAIIHTITTTAELYLAHLVTFCQTEYAFIRNTTVKTASTASPVIH